MPVQKLTKRSADALPVTSKTYVAYDDSLRGFGCRVTPNGAKSWVVEYRPGGGGRRMAKKRVTLGPLSTVNADKARNAAQTILAKARLGDDAASEKAARRAAPTLSELIEQYMREEVRPTRKPGTVALYELYFRRHVEPALGTRRAREITRAEIARLHRSVGAKAPVTANRVVMLLSGLYSWAGRAGEVPEDCHPTRGIKRYREEGKERYLSREELARLGDALREAETVGLPYDVDESNPNAKHAPKIANRRVVISPYVTAAIRLLLFTGCRVGEILKLRWQDVDLERGMLFLPDSKTGKKPVILSAPAKLLLAGLPRAGRYVVPGNNPDQPRHDLKRPWAAISKRAGIDGVRRHDLRHSFAATGAGSGLGLPIIGKLLGHRNVETTARYAHVDADPQKIAADRIAIQLAEAMGEMPESKASVFELGSRSWTRLRTHKT
jgi:integrase